MSRQPVVIVGGGPTGLSAAASLRTPWLLLEREEEFGGLARSWTRDGFGFDFTGHWLALRDAGLRSELSGLPGVRLRRFRRRARVWAGGRWLPAPLQARLDLLPGREGDACRAGLAAARRLPPRPAESFVDRLRARFGQPLCDRYLLPHNLKIWGAPLEELSAAWADAVVPSCAPAAGAESIRLLYPEQGGIGALAAALAARLDPRALRPGHALEAVDLEGRRLRTGDRWLPFSRLISTIPLPDLVAGILDAPPALRAAAALLRSAPVDFLCVALRRPVPVDWHWGYVPAPALPFHRVGVFSNVAGSMAPPGCASLWVELAQPPARCVSDEREVLAGLEELGAQADVAFFQRRSIPCGYVIFDHQREQARGIILAWLAQRGVHSCGRYGGWGYGSIAQAMLDGRRAAGE